MGKYEFSGLAFYVFISGLLIVMGGLSVPTLWQAGALRQASIIGALLFSQIGMFWANISATRAARWWLFYCAAQIVLTLLITMLLYRSGVSEISYLGSASLCLVGEALGLWGNSRKALLLSALYGGLALLLFALLLDREHFLIALLNMTVNGSFIVLLLVFFNQQLAAHQQAAALASSLEEANARLAESAARIEALTLQNERQRMARELHDTLAQGLAGLVLQLEATKAHLAAARHERAAAIIEQSLVHARSTLAASRAAIDDLRGARADLATSIQEQAAHFTQATGILCLLQLNIATPPAAQIVEHSRAIVSEALTNIARHAQASETRIRCTAAQGMLTLTICDNGKGFDVQLPVQAGHYGLLGMRERARLVGGTLTVEARAGQGSSIYLSVKLLN